MKPAASLPKILLLLEGATTLLASLVFYRAHDGSWGKFAALFLVPDLAMIGYVGGLKLGAACYNAAHTYFLPLGIGVLCYLAGQSSVVPLLAIWTAHIGFDRMIGLGLKYPTAFRHSHFNRM